MMLVPSSPKYLALADLHRRDGKLTEGSVLAEAVDPGSVLHDSFEWDDGAAAHAHRLSQARFLVRRFRVRIEVGSAEELRVTKVRAFVHDGEAGSYAPVGDVMADPVRRDALLERTRRDLVAFRVKLAGFAEFGGVVAAIDELG